jgi:hypothetical protein
MSALNGAAVESPGQAAEDGRRDREEGRRCLACVHPWSEHSALDVRFCTATLAMSHERGCICGPVRGR